MYICICMYVLGVYVLCTYVYICIYIYILRTNGQHYLLQFLINGFVEDIPLRFRIAIQ